MKITKTQLRALIREAVEDQLNAAGENSFDEFGIDLNPQKVSKQITMSMKTHNWDWARNEWGEAKEEIMAAIDDWLGKPRGDDFEYNMDTHTPIYAEYLEKGFTDKDRKITIEHATMSLKKLARDLLTL